MIIIKDIYGNVLREVNADSLVGANLQYADLRGADLQHANLQDADLRDADLQDAHLRYADLRDAHLQHADLRGADLLYANLRGANLLYADLLGANLRGATYGKATLSKGFEQITGLLWPVFFFDNHIKIGCQMHTTKQWEKMSKAAIALLDSRATEFWEANKATIIAAAHKHQD